MKITPLALLLFTTLACFLGTQHATPAETKVAAKTPDAATVKKNMTPAQLALGDPITNSIGMVLVPIPAGEFMMGSSISAEEIVKRFDLPEVVLPLLEREHPQHRVEITKPFYLSVYEVTQQQYEKVMGTRPWQGKDNVQEGPDYPAVLVSWNDAVEFCRKLSEQEGVKYRLPTEAQWEYACRAGTTTAYSYGDDESKLGEHAWNRTNAWDIGEKYAHRVGQKPPNPWGLYDIHGNVFEWCQDWFALYGSEKAVSDPAGPASGRGGRVLRGGSFLNETVSCRSALRSNWLPDPRFNHVGFRVSRTYKAETAAAAKPSAETPATAKTPDAATVKKHMTPAQLALGDPIVNSIGMVLVPIPAGRFQMGGPDSDKYAFSRDKPQHLVKITKPFYLSVHEVTQRQYEKVMGVRPWQGKRNVKDGPDFPAVYVSHGDAVEFCRRLSEQEGVEYRLPTEAQWEYACRAGTKTVYSFGDDESKLGQYAWYRTNAWNLGEKYGHRVGQKLPNPWGLFDMHGNVFEWCQDWYAPYGSEKAVSDPGGPASGSSRLLRGGSFYLQTSSVRSAYRVSYQPTYRHLLNGFRPSRTYNLSP